MIEAVAFVRNRCFEDAHWESFLTSHTGLPAATETEEGAYASRTVESVPQLAV